MTNTSEGNTDPRKEKPKNFFLRFYSRFRKPIKILLATYLVLLGLASLFSFPAVRALFYPIYAQGQNPVFSIREYTPIFTTNEKPTFLVGSAKNLNYELKIFNAEEVDKFAKPDRENPGTTRIDVAPGAKRFQCENLDYAALYDATNHFAKFKPIASLSGPVKAQDLGDATMNITMPEPLKPGDYVGVMATPGMRERANDSAFVRFRVTDLGALVKHDSEKIVISTVNLITRKPWAKAIVTVMRADNLLNLASPIGTDANGIATIKRPDNCLEQDWNSFVLDVNSGAHGAYFGSLGPYSYHYDGLGNSFGGYSNSKYRAYVNTDRPVYRLNQTINFKGYVRKVSPKGLVNPGAGVQLQITLNDPDGNLIRNENVRLDASGAFSGLIKAAQITKTGVYNIMIGYPDQQMEGFGIMVDQYRKPDFKVEVTPVKERYERGDKVRFKIQANYFFGAPLKEAKIKYQVSASTNSDLKNQLSTKNTADSAFFRGWDTDPGYYNSSEDAHDVFAKEGEIMTDVTGAGFIEFDAPKAPPANTRGPYNYGYLDDSVNVSVETTDLSRKTFTAEGSVPVTNGDFAIILDKPDSSILKAGEPISLRVRALDYQKKPVASKRVEFKLARWKWDQKLFQLDGSYTPLELATLEGTTDADGVATVTFKTESNYVSDTYYITAEARDDKKRVVGDITSVWMLGAANEYYFQNRSQEEQFSIQLDKDIYKPNETLKAIIKAPLKEGEEAYVLATIEGASLRAYKQIKMNGPVATVDFPIDPSYMPNAYISATYVMPDHNPVTTSRLVKVSPYSNFVNVSLSTDKPQYQPGETIKYKVTAKTETGSPVANMAMCASVVDEGMFAVYEELKKTMYADSTGADICSSLYRKIENEVQTSFTFCKRYVPEPYKPPVFDGAGLAVLHSPLFFFWQAQQEFESQSRSLGAPAGGGGRPMAEMATDLSALPAPSAAPRAGKAMSLGGAEEGGAPAKAAPIPRVRSNFVDTASWNPSLVTAADGTATFSVKLPDDLTTWRATVFGATSGISVGTQTKSTLCTNDFLARLALPRFYTEYDETVISGLIHNLSPGDLPVTVTLTTTPNIQLIDAPTVKLNVPKDGVKRQSWKVKVLKAGEAKVTLKAIGITLADAEERKLPVRTFGYRVFFAKNGLIKEDQKDLVFPIKLPSDAQLADGSFDLSASASSIGPVLGNFENLISYPYGCTEQTLSRLIPSVVARRLSKELNVEMSPEMNEKFKEAAAIALPKLTEYQHEDGGWGWWRDDQSDPYMTAHVLEGYHLLRAVGVNIAPDRMVNAKNYLAASVNTLTANTWGRFESENQAKAVYVLSLYGEKLDPLTRTWQLTNLKKMTPEALSYLIMAFKNAGDDKAAEQLYARLKELRSDSLEYANWEHNAHLLKELDFTGGLDYTYRFTSVETTALALRATVMMEPKNDALLDQITRWLILERDENGWNNTKTTAAVFLALLEKELAQDHNRTTNFTARLEILNKMVKQLAFNKTFERGEQSASIPLVPVSGSITLKKNGPGWMYYSSLLSYNRPLKPGEQPVLKSIPSDLVIHREWYRLVKSLESKPGETLYETVPLGNEPIHAGEIIKMVVSVKCPFTVPYTMVEAYLPSGGEVLSTPPRLAQDEDTAGILSENDHWYWWSHQDILDDRITFFAGEMPSGTARFTSFIRMEMPGKFNVNPVNMEGMYTNKVHARSAAHTITVVE
jgi:uncharacterized protein YfaS (alpha-2-macroglobulin family)